MSESTTYFSSRDESASHSRSTRRAASLGPGISLSQWDLDDDELDEAIDLHDVPAEGENLGEWVGVSRRGRDHTLRSASALPMTHDGTSWYRDGFSRRPSFSDEVDPLANGVRDLAPFSSHERGPSPAYTPVPDPLLAEPRRSSLRRSHSPRPSREPGLSPIHSAPASRAASERDDNSETANRRPSLAMRNGLPGEALTEDALWRPEAPADMASESEVDEDAAGPVAPGPARPILEGGGHRVASGEVRFAQNVRGGMSSGRVEPHLSSSPEALPPTNRAASIRTMNSAFSESSTSLTSSSQEHSGGETHPVVAVVRPISAASTSGNLPTPSTAPSIQARASTETFPRASMSSNSSTGGGLHSYYDLVTPPSGSSRRSSLLSRGVSRPLVGGDTSLSPGSISDTSPEVTQGRKSRLCSASTIVRNGGNDSTPSSSIPTIPRAQREDSAFSPQPASDSLSPSSRVSKQRGNGSATLSREPSEDGRGRNKSKFNLSAALRGLSKGRISSTSRTRADKSRTPSFIEPPPPVPSVSMAMARGASGSAVPPRLFDGQSLHVFSMGSLHHARRGRNRSDRRTSLSRRTGGAGREVGTPL